MIAVRLFPSAAAVHMRRHTAVRVCACVCVCVCVYTAADYAAVRGGVSGIGEKTERQQSDQERLG